MELSNQIIQEAEFSPKIKKYTLFVVAFFLFVSFIGILLLIPWFLGVGQYFSKRYYDNLFCKLTTRHLEFKKGVFFKIEKTIPLENIQDLTFIENPILRILDLRIIKIETASQGHPQSSDMKLVGIIEPYQFKEKVLRQRDVLKSGEMSGIKTPFADNDKTHELLSEIRDLLNDIKNK